MARTTRICEYSDALADEVCLAVENNAKGLRALCKENKHWPPASTLRLWMKSNPYFAVHYARAKESQVENLVEEIIEISDDESKDFIETSDGQVVFNNVALGRARLRTDNRKWIASKLLPKIYGDKKEEKENDKNDFVSMNRDKIVE